MAKEKTLESGMIVNHDSMRYLKVSVKDELPKEEGKYIVFTKTPLGNGNIFACAVHFDKKGKANWGCNNQIVTHWLK